MRHLCLGTALCVSLAFVVSAQSLPTIPSRLAASTATADPALRGGRLNEALAISGLSLKMVFEPSATLTQDRASGTARLIGRAVDASFDLSQRNRILDVDVTLTGLTASVPPGSPKLEFFPGAYVSNGGPIDPSTWYYYTGLEGTLTGAGAWAGGRLRITRRGPAGQVGDGANNRNGLYGFSAWFSHTVEQQPTAGEPWESGHGDFNLNLLGECLCVDASLPSPAYSRGAATSVLETPLTFGCGVDWDVSRQSVLDLDRENGTARLVGELASRSDPTCRMIFDLTLAGQVEPGNPSHPPQGGPWTGNIMPSGLFSHGGAIDPSQWFYYQDVTGKFLGAGSLDGAEIAVSRRHDGLAPQVGPGAARNLEYGLFAPFHLDVLRQPGTGNRLAPADAQLWLQLDLCLTPVLKQHGARPVPALPSVTAECFRLEGCTLDLVDSVRFGSQVIQSQDPCDLGRGYFEIIDPETVCVYPPLCLPPGDFDVTVSDENGVESDPVLARIVEPASPTLACAPFMRAGCSQSVWIWGGPTGPLRYCVIVSPSLAPSVIPGIVTLGIGNNFSNFFAFDGMHPNCYEQFIGTVPVAAAGLTLYFQAVAGNPNHMTLPLPTTNICSTTYGIGVTR